MKYIFYGSPKFAKIILEKVIELNISPIAIICNPDRPVGRKKIITPPLTKTIAKKYNIEVFQPKKLIDIKNNIENIKPDFAIIAAYSKIISQEILDIPKFGTFGIHPSLLPCYRGATPIQTTILNGDKNTGVTIFRVDSKVDHGNIILQKQIEIEKSDTYISLEKKLALIGAELFIDVIQKIEKKEIIEKIQDETKATFTKKFITKDGFIEYRDILKAQKNDKNLSSQIERKIRAIGHEPGVWTIMNSKRTKLLETSITSDGLLHIKKIHVEGKLPQNV